MPIKIPNDLPAVQTLNDENIFVMTDMLNGIRNTDDIRKVKNVIVVELYFFMANAVNTVYMAYPKPAPSPNRIPAADTFHPSSKSPVTRRQPIKVISSTSSFLPVNFSPKNITENIITIACSV